MCCHVLCVTMVMIVIDSELPSPLQALNVDIFSVPVPGGPVSRLSQAG